MNGGAPDWDRFAHWPRGAARAVLALVVVVLLGAALTTHDTGLTIRNTPADRTGVEAEQAERDAETKVRDADLQLYDRIAGRVATGESYYTAAIEEQRAADFPVRPAVAVRLPTMAFLAALMGPEALGALLLLGAAVAGAWFVRLGDEPGGRERRVTGIALLLVGMAALVLTLSAILLLPIKFLRSSKEG